MLIVRIEGSALICRDKYGFEWRQQLWPGMPECRHCGQRKALGFWSRDQWSWRCHECVKPFVL